MGALGDTAIHKLWYALSNGTTYLPSNNTANLIQSNKSSISELVALSVWEVFNPKCSFGISKLIPKWQQTLGTFRRNLKMHSVYASPWNEKIEYDSSY